MNFEEGLEVADEAVFVKVGRRLNTVEIAVLQGSWQGQTYEESVSIDCLLRLWDVAVSYYLKASGLTQMKKRRCVAVWPQATALVRKGHVSAKCRLRQRAACAVFA